MTNTAATIADRILDRHLRGDGCAARTRGGIPRGRFARRCGGRVRMVEDCLEWRFPDGSVIQEYGSGWDTPAGWAANV